MRKLINSLIFINLMSDSNDMSTKVTDLENIKKLSSSIEDDLDNDKYLNEDTNKDSDKEQKLKKLQLEQLEQLKKLNKLKNKMSNDNLLSSSQDNSNSLKNLKTYENQISKEKQTEKKTGSKKIIDLIKLPVLVIILYVIISHPKFSQIFGKYVKFLKDGDNGPTLVSLLIKGFILAVLIFVAKIILNC